ncbi:hypothetical protein BJX96DRAFT_141541 [Aspergillus floccosus]
MSQSERGFMQEACEVTVWLMKASREGTMFNSQSILLSIPWIVIDHLMVIFLFHETGIRIFSPSRSIMKSFSHICRRGRGRIGF